MKWLLLAVMIVNCQHHGSNTLSGPATDDEIPLIAEQFLAEMRRQGGFNGSVLIRKRGADLFKKSVGYEDFDQARPLHSGSRFRIASLTKQFTAVGILTLVEHGTLGLDDTLCSHINLFCQHRFDRITIHHLLSHTSGLPRVSSDGERWRVLGSNRTPIIEYVRLALEQELLFDPGDDYEYSNFGFRILSYLIELKTSEPFTTFMDSAIFSPATLSNSGVETVDASPLHITDGLIFSHWDAALNAPVFLRDDSGRVYGTGYGSGGGYSSIDDLAQWSQSLDNHVIISEFTTEVLFTPVRDHSACGWKVKRSGLNGKIYQTANGKNPAYFSEMWRIPEDDLLIIVLGNVDSSRWLTETVGEFVYMARGLPYNPPM